MVAIGGMAPASGMSLVLASISNFPAHYPAPKQACMSRFTVIPEPLYSMDTQNHHCQLESHGFNGSRGWK